MGSIPDNDGYYQDVDDAIDDYDEFVEKQFKQKPIKHHNELSQKDEKLIAISEQYDSTTRSGRRKYCKARDKIWKERQAQYKKDIAEGTYNDLPSSKTFCKCICCGGGFVAKKADIRRGWAKFCSKSCKATYG